MSGPAVSIVMPSYNGGELLEQAIGSCLVEREIELEVLVVDDASADDTRRRLEAVAKRDSRVVPVLLEVNHGAGAVARNIGIERARGEYVKFLDHDDVLEPGTLGRELTAARSEGADLVMSDWGVCEIDSRGRRVLGSERIYEPPPVDGLIDAILRRDKVPYTAAVLYRRGHLEGVEWDPMVTIIDDFDFFCRSALKPGRIARSPGVSYWWRRHTESIQGRQQSNPLAFLDSAYILERIYRRVEELLEVRGELTTARKAELAQIYYKGVRAFARFDRQKCREVLVRIFELAPGFRPAAGAESSALLRATARVAGVRATVALYGGLRRAVDRLAPPSGWLSFRGERGGAGADAG